MLVRRNQDWLPEVFNELFDTFVPKTASTSPAINVIERDGEYAVELAAPGMTRDDFKVSLDENDNLVVDLEKKTDEGEKDPKNNERYLRREFSYTKFHQTLLLPDDVDREHIAASVDHGVLTVTLPKLNAEQMKKESKVIEIK